MRILHKQLEKECRNLFFQINETIKAKFPIVKSIGMETSDHRSFFSSEYGGYRIAHVCKDNTILIFLSTSGVKIRFNFDVFKKGFRMVSWVRFVKDSLLLDYVHRLVFDICKFKYVLIGNKKIFHKKRNIYHQYLTKKCFLVMHDNKKVSIETDIKPCEYSKNLYIYVRDHKEGWVVHSRVFPGYELGKKYFGKIFNNGF